MNRRLIGSAGRRAALVAAAMIVPAACGGREPSVIEVDLREPTTVSDIAPDARTLTLTTVDGPADFTVRLPRRTITGEYRRVLLVADENVAADVAADDPSRAIRLVDLDHPVSDDPTEVAERLRSAIVEFEAEGAERAELERFIAEFEAAVAAAGGTIDTERLVPAGSSAIREFGLRVTEHDAVSLRVRLFDDDRVLIVTSVRFDP